MFGRCRLIGFGDLRALVDQAAVFDINTVGLQLFLRCGLFDKAQANQLIIANPAKRLTASARRALTPEERTAYLAACKTHPFGQFAAFLYFFGLRRGEALALERSDVILGINKKPVGLSIRKQFVYPHNNQPVISTVKTSAGERTLPIPEKAHEYIDFRLLPSGLLFCATETVDDRKTEKPFSYSEIIDRWRSFIRFALGNDTDVTMHVMRHNFCTMLFENGVDIMSCRYLMGHEDIKTTLEIYAHYTETIKKNDLVKVIKIG